MTARTHDLFAFGALLTVAAYFPPTAVKPATALVGIVANIVGALLPDIDQASNRLWDLLPGGNALGKILKNLFLTHRTLSHSFLGTWLVYQALNWILSRLFNSSFVDIPLITVAMMIGYISHLALDGLTEEGLPLLFPLKIRFGFPPIKSWRIKTGGWFEKLVIFPGIIVYIAWLVWSNWRRLFV